MTEEEKNRLIAQILRVDHAGEHGAISIYGNQLARACKKYPDLIEWLETTLAHEVSHRQQFRDQLDARGIKPCGALAVWALGGSILGWLTALFGRVGVLACTAAVERTVHRHLVEQIDFLQENDPELADITRNILIEEDEHLAFAENNHDAGALRALIIAPAVAMMTKALILLSTRGEALLLDRRLRRR